MEIKSHVGGGVVAAAAIAARQYCGVSGICAVF